MKFLIALGLGALIPITDAKAQSTPRAPTQTLAPSSAQHSGDWQNRRANAGFQDEYNTKVLLGAGLAPAKQYALARTVVACLVRSAPDTASAMVGGPMTADRDFSALTRALSGPHGSCVDQKASGIPMALVSGALAEELIVKENRVLEPRAMAVDVTEAERFYGGGRSRSIASVARCLAVYSPGMTKAVLLSPSGSDEERGALTSLYAKSPECEVGAPPANIPIEEQRSALASGLYLWTNRG